MTEKLFTGTLSIKPKSVGVDSIFSRTNNQSPVFLFPVNVGKPNVVLFKDWPVYCIICVNYGEKLRSISSNENAGYNSF